MTEPFDLDELRNAYRSWEMKHTPDCWTVRATAALATQEQTHANP